MKSLSEELIKVSENRQKQSILFIGILHILSWQSLRYILLVNLVQFSFLPRFVFIYIQANGIIKKLQGEVRGLVGKIKVKNTVTVSQEKVLQDVSDKLQDVTKDLQSTHQQLITKNEQVCLRSCVCKASFLKSPVCSDWSHVVGQSQHCLLLEYRKKSYPTGFWIVCQHYHHIGSGKTGL